MERSEASSSMEMEQQLMSMGFSQLQASQALKSTSSLEQATDWILTQNLLNANPSYQTPIQPSLDRFFSSSNDSPNKKANPNPNRSQKPNPSPNPKRLKTQSPLSDRMRPPTLSHVVGQDHLLGPTSLISSSVTAGELPSLVLWGPPGSGKTSIARALTSSLPSSYRFVSISAAAAGVSDVRKAIADARDARSSVGARTVLFVDEVHRFSKSQLDSFLPAIEDGSIVFVGATTENPSFHLTTPLLSRSRVLALEPLKPQHVKELLKRAVDDKEKGLGGTVAQVDEEAIEFLSVHCDGDARVALNALEVAATLVSAKTNGVTVGVGDVKEAMQCKHLAYDKDGEEHYNLISALHKSIRGNDPDAAIYWLARMLEAGEKPLYIARRLVRLASEDVGLADPAALSHAVACYEACHFIGMPECDVNLAQCVAYLALAPKSVAVYKALGEAKNVVKESGGGNAGVPLHLRNAPTELMKEFGYGEGYVYTPDDPEASKNQIYLPLSLQGRKFLHWPPS